MHALARECTSFLTDFNTAVGLISLDTRYVPDRRDLCDRVIVKEGRSSNECFSPCGKKCVIGEILSVGERVPSSRLAFVSNRNAWNTNFVIVAKIISWFIISPNVICHMGSPRASNEIGVEVNVSQIISISYKIVHFL